MNILLVEDELKLVTFLKMGFEENRYEVDIALDGRAGHQMALRKRYDLIILDIGLPLLSGYELCRLIRLQDAAVPILMLTALGTVDNKMEAFNLGADDYLLKPFDFQELLARVKALTRRAVPRTAEGVLTAGDLELNPQTKTVRREGLPIRLTAREFALLNLLLRHKNEVLSRSAIAARVWAISFDTGTNVVCIGYLNTLRTAPRVRCSWAGQAAGHWGAVVPDDLQGFGAGHHEWLEPLLTFARRAALVVQKDFRAFRASYKAGEVGIAPLVLLAH